MTGLNWGSLQACLDGLLRCNLRPVFCFLTITSCNDGMASSQRERETKVVDQRFQKQKKSDGSTRVNLRVFFVIVTATK
jgi:hypothetical protein